MMTVPVILQESHSLRQVAGNITIEIEPGQTKFFTWGLLTDKEKSSPVNISAVGIGAEYLSFPKRVELPAGETYNLKTNVTIPFDHPGGMAINATLHATEPSESTQTSQMASIVNLEMAKKLYIQIDQNPFPEFRQLIFKSYIEKAKISDKEYLIPIESTSNVTEFSFNQNNRSIDFKLTGYGGTNGTTIIYPAKLLQAPYFLTFDGKAFTDFQTVTNNKTGEKGVKVTYPHDTMHDSFALAAFSIITP